MAVSAAWYGQAIKQAFTSGTYNASRTTGIDFASDTIKVMLCTGTYSPDQDTHVFKSSVTNEVTGAGYSAGGATLANKTLTYTAGTNIIMFDADDVTWGSSTITAHYAVIYDGSPGTDATRPLLGYVNFGADVPSNNGNFTIQWDTAGILKITPGVEA